MSDKTVWESVKAEGGAILDKLKDLLREGNIRRVRKDPPRGDAMPSRRREVGERISGTVLRRVASVGNRQQGDVDGQKGPGFIEPGH